MSISDADILLYEELIAQAIKPLTSAHQPGFGAPRSQKKLRVKLSDGELDQIATNYWFGRTDSRRKNIESVKQWIIWAFLHIEDCHGQGRTHEIEAAAGVHVLRALLFDSAELMRRNTKCKIDMRPPCWWDIQEHYHHVARKDIHRLAEDIHERLLDEAIEQLIASEAIRYQHGYWLLLTNASRGYIRLLKRHGKWRAADPIVA